MITPHKLLGKIASLEGLVLFNRLRKPIKVFFLQVDLVKCLIDSCVIFELARYEVLLDERETFVVFDNSDALAHVNVFVGSSTGNSVEKLIKLHGLLVKVELDSPVVQVVVSNLDDVADEVLVLESCWRVLHHARDGTIVLGILVVEQHHFWPQLLLLARSNQHGDVYLFVLLHNVAKEHFWIVLSVKNSQFSRNVVGFVVILLLAIDQKVDQLANISKLFIMVAYAFKMIGMVDNMDATLLSNLELLGSDTGKVHLFPDLRDVGSLGRFHCALKVSQLDIGDC